jgi:serine/threonine protein kinase/ABC-type phosphate transport system substrate-binding protein
MTPVPVIKALACLLPFVLLLLASTNKAYGAVSLYGVGEYSLYPTLTSLAGSYSYHKDTVTVTYSGTATVPIVILAFDISYSVFGAFDSQVDMSSLDPDTLQLPLFGSGITFVYNTSTPLSDILVLDGDTLGRIWSGNITNWSDQSLVDLNPNATLPDAEIMLCYGDPSIESISMEFLRGLRLLSPEFDSVLTAANGNMSLLPPMLDGRGVFIGTNSTGRINCTQNTPNSLTYSDWASSTRYTKANLINKAGFEVGISVASVQSAMTDFQSELQNDLLISLIDGPGNTSYPFSYVSTVIIGAEGNSTDCTQSQELAQFLSWLLTNQRVSDRVSTGGWAPLTVAYKKKIIDVLGTIMCDDENVLTTAYLIGEGTSRPALTDLAGQYTSATVTQKYFTSDMATAITDMREGAIDYADLTTGVTSSQLALTISEVAHLDLVPILAYAAMATYNIPEIRYNTLALNLTLEIWAQIYLNQITRWNDPIIVAINPAFASLLPNASITVLLGTAASPLTRMVTTALRNASPNFNATVGIVDVPTTYPVQMAVNRSVDLAGVESALASRMNTLAYGFTALSSGQLLTSKNVRSAALYNPSTGQYVVPSTDAILAAMQAFSNATLLHLFQGALNAPTDESYPLVLYDILLTAKNSTDCTKAAALADWIYWTQSAEAAEKIALRDGVVLTSTITVWKKMMLTAVARMSCDGKNVSSIAGCVSDGELCSDNGLCVSGACECADGWAGTHCELSASSAGSDSSTILAATLGSVLPAALFVVVLLVVLAIVLVVLARRKQRKDEWEIDTNELEMAETLGTGGYGEVFRAKWRGTEVAVKMMAAKDNLLTRDMQRNFAEEVRVMTALRHPNVVLFMAACTKPPNMCIVMEFMGLGSLYELLHNELIPELPIALKVKMAYQAAKGMHFLHSSGIVHRDLKSLNLLLDNKWNVKVSDFGLTKFKEESKSSGASNTALQGSIHWTAPEVLNENPDVDFILADVYSFGIILWELLTREQPFAGMSPAAVAVAVIRDNLRPAMPSSEMADTLAMESASSPEYVELLTSCWHADPTIRPTFLEIMTRLSAMIGDSSTNYSKTTSSSSSSSGAAIGTAGGIHARPSIDSSWTLPSTAASSSSGSGSGNSRSKDYSGKMGAATAGGIRAPEGEVTIVFTDITRAASLWEFNPAAMKDATVMHNEALRSLLKQHGGYEVVFLRDRNSGEGSFCLAFQRTEDALAWCMSAQQTLNQLEWPEGLLEHPGAAEEWGDTDDRVLFRGLRVRMGVHVGIPKVVRDPMTRRVEYIGPVVNAAARITALTHGGQVLISHHAFQRIAQSDLAQEKNRLTCLGKFEMLDSEPEGAKLYELKSKGLEARFFGGVSKEDDMPEGLKTGKRHGKGKAARDEGRSGDLDASFASSAGSAETDDSDVQQAVGEGMMFKEDNFLTSANLCRWVLDFNEIALGKQIGMGSYGMVYKGKWKGVEVAVKRFIKQKLDERHMLDFRAEMAFLSELHHPNIVLFIGACVKRPNLCIVTEFVKQGSLKEILLNNGIKLTWNQKLGLLRSAALGINYLHSLHPVIVHRDLKPSNLLVDENWNVKVADFGFARIKEENVTMTRCGTPCWTAPEIIRGEKYSEKADVYSFGVIMWEVLTRKQPYAGRNFMGVSLDVLEGRRPQIPPDTPQDFRKMVKRCWHGTADKRPAMEEIIGFLDSMLGGEGGAAADKV